MLEKYDGSNLVDYRTPAGTRAAALPQHRLSRNGSQPLVTHPHRDWKDASGQPPREPPRFDCRRALAARQ
jgi:hypothetical protein